MLHILNCGYVTIMHCTPHCQASIDRLDIWAEQSSTTALQGGWGAPKRKQQEGSKHAYPSDRDAHCLLKAMSFRHSNGLLAANRSISLSATDS